jgi:cytochrome c2
VLIARSQEGFLYRFDVASGAISRIVLRLPENNFVTLPEKTPWGETVNRNWLRYTDLAFIGEGDARALVVSYTYFNVADACFTNRLAIHELEPGWDEPIADGATTNAEGWRVVYETRPCLRFKKDWHPFAGNQAGGRIALDKDRYLYLTVGDFEFDGKHYDSDENKTELYPQLVHVDYGKTLRFDPHNWSVSIFTIGHKNPQGIAVDDDGGVWETEHGPMGGDELNLLQPGNNYGWPLVTLGVGYTDKTNDAKSWSLNPLQGRHVGYVAPVFAWMPDVAVSTVKLIRGLNPRIDGDLLVASLVATSIFRLRLEGERVLYAEQTQIGERVRYAAVGNGEIYLLLDSGRFATLRPRPTGGDEQVPAKGGAILASCLECHARPNAPQLAGIVGYGVASQPGVTYSSALQKAGGIWTEARLRAFLTNPAVFAPGTSMPNPGLSTERIDAIVATIGARAN